MLLWYLDLGSATDSIHVPVGTTGERPGSPAGILDITQLQVSLKGIQIAGEI